MNDMLHPETTGGDSNPLYSRELYERKKRFLASLAELVGSLGLATTREETEALWAKVQAADNPRNRPYRVKTGREVADQPPKAWLVRGLLPAQGLSAIFGPSGSGKSFLALDLACAVAEGAQWFGFRTHATPVLYVVIEGRGRFSTRLGAWERHRARPLPETLRFVDEPFEMLIDVARIVAAAASLGPNTVIFIDTLSAAVPGLKENDPDAMGKALAAAQEIARGIDGAVVLIGHTGKDESKGWRGHSSNYASVDGAVQTGRKDGQRYWIAAKARDGEDGAVFEFDLLGVDLGHDSDGEPVTSCVVVQGDATDEIVRPSVTPAQHLGANQRQVMDVLNALVAQSNQIGRGGASSDQPCVEVEAALTAVANTLISIDPKRRRARARETIASLVERGVIAQGEGWLWRT